MIAIPAGMRVYLAMGPTDMRNYAERRIMRSPGWSASAHTHDIKVLWALQQLLLSA